MKSISLILLIITTSLVSAQDRIHQLDSLFTSCNNGELNGNILIAEKGRIIYSKSLGIADQKTEAKLNANSIFELASISKQFTAMAVVMLKERGKLNYDDKITRFFPGLSDYSNITIRYLLHHSSGLPDYMEQMSSIIDKSKIATNKDVISWLSVYKPKLLFEPNTQYEYSNTGYVLLASVVEKVAGVSYAEFLAVNIFRPLRMKNTFVYSRRYKPVPVRNYAYGYVYADSIKKYILPDDLPETRRVIWYDGVVGDKGVSASIVDLLKWDRALYENRLISKQSKAEMFTSGELNDKTKTGYGFGWYVQDNGIYGDIVEHTGSWPGYRTLLERHIKNDKTIIALVNFRNDSTYIPLTETRRILYNIKPPHFIELSKEELEKFTGDYKNANGRIVKMIFENGSLYKVTQEGDKSELKPVSKNKFLLLGFSPDVFYEFIVKDDKVEKYIMTQPEEKIERVLTRIQ